MFLQYKDYGRCLVPHWLQLLLAVLAQTLHPCQVCGPDSLCSMTSCLYNLVSCDFRVYLLHSLLLQLMTCMEFLNVISDLVYYSSMARSIQRGFTTITVLCYTHIYVLYTTHPTSQQTEYSHIGYIHEQTSIQRSKVNLIEFLYNNNTYISICNIDIHRALFICIHCCHKQELPFWPQRWS